MKKLIYKICKYDENGISELISRDDCENEIKKEWEELIPEKGFDYYLSVGWELNGKSLGTTLLNTK